MGLQMIRECNNIRVELHVGIKCSVTSTTKLKAVSRF
jgi:hypothetical protein